MSEAAAKILGAAARQSSKGRTDTKLILGTITKLSPLTIKFDAINFDVTNVFINHLLLKHKKIVAQLPDEESKKEVQYDPDLEIGDRVVGTKLDGTSYIVLCKVVQK